MKNIVIIGTGGVGREVAWIIEEINKNKKIYNILGFIDDDRNLTGKKINGYDVLGDVQYLIEKEYKGNVVIAIADFKFKKNILNKLVSLEVEFPNIISPTVKFHNSFKLGKGNVIYDEVHISPNVEIGDYCIISSKSLIGHDVKIRKFVSIYWNVIIAGNNLIGNGVLLKTNVVINQNKKVNDYEIVEIGEIGELI